MENRELERAVGDALHIGDCVLTVIDIDGDEVAFRIDHGEAGRLSPAVTDRSCLPRK